MFRLDEVGRDTTTFLQSFTAGAGGGATKHTVAVITVELSDTYVNKKIMLMAALTQILG